MVLVVAIAGMLAYLRLRADLDAGISSGLRARADDAVAIAADPPPRLGDSTGSRLSEAEESFTQVYAGDGRLLASTPGPRSAALSAGRVRAVSASGVETDTVVDGIEGTARVLARRTVTARGERVVAVGASLGDRDETLAGLLGALAAGGAVAVLLASAAGYALARAGLAPIEAMRLRARRISLERPDERLPLPAADDELRRLGVTLNEMLERLNDAVERERRFVADAGHELRTPVAVLKTEIEGLLRRGEVPAGARAPLAAAAEEADQLAQLVDDLLLIAAAPGGRVPVRAEPTRLRGLLERNRDRFADRAAAHGRTISVDAPGDLEAGLDPQRMRQALGNLVENALRHGAGDVALAARRRDGAVEIDVTDAGDGFAPGLSGRAFERFARGDGARARGGSGLGLAIVRAIAEAHGGTAEIAGGEGRTTVRLRLPLSGPSHPAAPSSAGSSIGGDR